MTRTRGTETRSSWTWLVGMVVALLVASGLSVLGVRLLAGAVGGGAQDFGPPLILKASALAIRSAGEALPGGGWQMRESGALGEYLVCPRTGEYRISVFASGSSVDGAWPLISPFVDNRRRGPGMTVWGQWNAYSWTLRLRAGVHAVVVGFGNEGIDLYGSRVLSVREFLARAQNGHATPRVTTRRAWLASSGSKGR